MSNQFINPVTTTFALLEKYKGLVRHNLEKQGLSAEEVDHVVKSLALDQKLYFTINRSYQPGQQSFRQFCDSNGLSMELADVFHKISRLHQHQEEAIRSILDDRATVVSTGTGSGKTETFLIPILDHCLKHPGAGVKAIIIYPMNALANDQVRRIKEIAGELGITHGLFTGATPDEERDAMRLEPPDILITNYVMLDWMLTRAKDQPIWERSRETLRYVVLDEIHTYRGNKATHLKYLLARLRSRLAQVPVQIGTSATLQKGGDDAEQNGRDASGQFIRNLLEVDKFTLVKPIYLPEATLEREPQSLDSSEDTSSLDWQLDADTAKNLRMIGLLLGKSYSFFDLDPLRESRLYADLQSSPFVRSMRAALVNQGAQTFIDLVRIFYRLPGSEGVETGEAVVKAYLSAISFLNHLLREGKEAPLLDFRIHLFISDIGGYLKRCLKCHRYHSGRQEFCLECGYPLFHVHKNHLNACIGKVSQNRLRWELRPRSDDRKNSYFVLIHLLPHTETTPLPEESTTLSFEGLVRPDDGEIELSHQAEGEYTLQALPIVKYEEIEESLIPLIDKFYAHEYLITLVSSWLDFQPASQKKLLGFMDSRARANRYASILRDELASRFLDAFLRHHFPMFEGGAPIGLVYKRLKQAVAGTNVRAKLEQELLDEIDLWYWRLLSISPRKAERYQDLLSIKDWDQFAPVEQELLQIFLQERAIDKTLPDSLPQTNAYVRFRLYLVEQLTGIYGKSGETSNARNYQSISLSKQGQLYREFVAEQTEEAIQETLDALTTRGVLVQKETPDAKLHYYLNADYVLFNPPAERPDDYSRLRQNFLLTSKAHSSESKEREKLEKEFKEGSVHCLIATPTLEMGIDIGDLQGVLMLGVPPEPSNYVQRAGRAGRGQKSSAATVVTFCREGSPHDQIYYANPKEMIDGEINPPVFDPDNWQVVARHVHAFLLTEAASSVADARLFLRRFQQDKEQYVNQVCKVFGSQPRIETYLRQEFAQALQDEIEKHSSGGFQVQLYNSGFFPDYGFRRDAICVLDAGAMQERGLRPEKMNEYDLGEHTLREYTLGERDPEQAYLDLVPGTSVFMSDNVYALAVPSTYEDFRLLVPGALDPTPVTVRSYAYLLGQEEVLHAQEDEEIARYDRLLLFDAKQQYVDRKVILQTAYHPDCALYFINGGVRKPENEIEHFHDDEEAYCFGYRLERESFILRFAGDVCGDNEIPISFASAFYNALIEHYKVDASEVGLLIAARPLHVDDPNSFYVVIYDRTGNKALPLAQIQNEFNQMVEATYRRVVDCPSGAESSCDDGCYRCCKSYSLGYWSGSVKRGLARMVAGYLLGRERFVPELAEPEVVHAGYDLELNLREQRDHFVVRSSTGHQYHAAKGESYNGSIFDLLIRSIRAEWQPEIRRLRITSKLFIVDTINKGHLKNEREHFSQLQFELLRFDSVTAEKG